MDKFSTTVEAVQWQPEDLVLAGQIAAWLQMSGATFKVNRDKSLTVYNGINQLAQAGDWIVKLSPAYFEVYKADAFRARFTKQESGGGIF